MKKYLALVSCILLLIGIGNMIPAPAESPIQNDIALPGITNPQDAGAIAPAPDPTNFTWDVSLSRGAGGCCGKNGQCGLNSANTPAPLGLHAHRVRIGRW